MRQNQLDSLRGIAALSVFFSHFIGLFQFTGSDSINLFNVISNSPIHLFWAGHSAVMLFFVLSGYVLAYPYVSARALKLEVIPFIIRRVLRIYPAYLLSLVFFLVLKSYLFYPDSMAGLSAWINIFWKWNNADFSLAEFLKYCFMIGPQFNYNLINPVTWTLIVEMRISLIFPVFIILFQQFNHVYTYFTVIVVLVLVNVLGDVGIIYYVPFFIMGALLAKYNLYLYNSLNSHKLLISAAMVASVLLYTAPYTFQFLKLQNIIYDYLIGFGAIIAILLAVHHTGFSKILLKPNLIKLGDLSYSLYLFHLGVLLTTCSLILHFFGCSFLSFCAILAISLSVSIALSVVCFKYVELTFINIGKRLSKKLSSN